MIDSGLDPNVTHLAVVLLSGGLDSATTLQLARRDAFDVIALSFAYGQRHAIELDAARRVAARAGVREHRVVKIDLGDFGGSALTDFSLAVPKHRSEEAIGSGIPITYVPARNTIFLAYAIALAESRDAHDVFLGVNHLDSSGYPDCRPAFIAAFAEVARLGTRAADGAEAIRIHTPLIDLTKTQIIQLGQSLGVDYALTRSCYDPDADGAACGTCDSCVLRLRGFAGAGATDPAPYVRR